MCYFRFICYQQKKVVNLFETEKIYWPWLSDMGLRCPERLRNILGSVAINQTADYALVSKYKSTSNPLVALMVEQIGALQACWVLQTSVNGFLRQFW